jgi:hypothetical protein
VRIARRPAAAAIFVFLSASLGHAQSVQKPAADPFAAGRWHVEFALQAALEAWNYNTSHEELYGLLEGVTYGLRDGLVLTARQRTSYVSQRLNDTWLLGLTGGLRWRIAQSGRTSTFLQFDLGVSDTAIATPRRGTRFNYLLIGGGGMLVRLKPRLHLIATLELIHLSNLNLAGSDRNPDIEAIGPSLGLIVGF